MFCQIESDAVIELDTYVCVGDYACDGILLSGFQEHYDCSSERNRELPYHELLFRLFVVTRDDETMDRRNYLFSPFLSSGCEAEASKCKMRLDLEPFPMPFINEDPSIRREGLARFNS